MQIGPTLRKIREKRGLTLEDVAQRATVSAGQVSRWELETRNLDFYDFVKLCDVLEVLPGDLLPHTEGIPLRLQPLVSMLADRSDRDVHRATKIIAAAFEEPFAHSDLGEYAGPSQIMDRPSEGAALLSSWEPSRAAATIPARETSKPEGAGEASNGSKKPRKTR